MTFTPYSSQLDDLAKLRANNYTGLLAIETGGGKTVSSLLATKESGADQVLIIAPKSTHVTAWDETTQILLGEETRVMGNGNKGQKTALTDFEFGYPGVYAVTPQLFTRADISAWKPAMLICDEVHMLSKANSKGQRKLSGYSHSDNPLAEQAGMIMALSGTPARNNFERMWASTRLLERHNYRRGQTAYDNFYGWLDDRMDMEEVITGKKFNPRTKKYELTKAKKWLQETDKGRLFSEMECVVQHFRRDECCVHHPTGFLKHDAPNVITRTVELSAKQKRIIDELENQGLTWLDDNPFQVDLPITLQQRIRQVCLGVPQVRMTGEFDKEGMEKMSLEYEDGFESTFADEVENTLEHWGDEPAVIYMSSQRFAAALTKRLNAKGVKAFEFSGATSKTRDENLKKFGKEFRAMVATIESLGTGTDGIQKVCQNEIFIERSVDETNNIQAEARTDRMGAIGQVQRVIIQDDLGYAAGRFSDQLARKVALRQSTRVAV